MIKIFKAGIKKLFGEIYCSSTFDIKVHVFTLLFIDACISSFSCAISFSIDLALIFKTIKVASTYCNISFVSYFYPTYFGVVSTMLIAAVRLFLAKKVFKCNRPSNFKVTFWAISLLVLIAAVNIVHAAVNMLLDIPFGKTLEGCARGEEPRNVSLTNLLMLLVVNIYPVISIIIDLFLLAFIRKTIMPTTQVTTVTVEFNRG